MPKQARLSGIKSFRCYTFEEAAQVAGVSPRTIRAWSADGLCIMDDERPALVRGDDLHSYIKSKRADRKVKTSIDTFYCMRCRKERRAAQGLADCTIKGSRATLTALCETCETVMSKPVALRRLTELEKILDLIITRS